MKERFFNVLAWTAFSYALVLYGSLLYYALSHPKGVSFAFTWLVLEEVLILTTPAIVPALLYIWTGSPRILPWRKPSQTAEEG